MPTPIWPLDIEEKLTSLVDDADFQELDLRLRRFNLFEALGVVTGELKHSNFLAFILSPARPHGLGTEVLLRLLRAILAKIPAEQRTIGALELTLADLDAAVVYREQNNIDLLVEIKEIGKERGLVVVIENKIDAQEGEGQLVRYKEIVRQSFSGHRQLFVFLTPEGRKPRDPAYVALGYGEFASLIEKLLNDRSDTISNEVSLILRHYVEMLRRNNIVQDEKLIAQAKRLYEKHKEAFDFVSQYQTRGSNLLDQVRALIESQRALVEDKHISTILRFIPTAWENIPELHSCPASEWTKTGRSVLFEVKANEDKRIIVALVLGPSNDPQLRQRIYSSAAKKPELFRGIVKPMGKKYSTIYSTTLLTALEAREVSRSDDEQIEAIGAAWQKFVSNDLPKLTDVIPQIVEDIESR